MRDFGSCCACFAVLFLSASASEAAFVKKYLEAKLLAQILSNAPTFHDTSMMASYPMLPKPNDVAFPQASMTWKAKVAPIIMESQHSSQLAQDPGQYDDELAAHHLENVHLDLPSQDELDRLTTSMMTTMMMMKTPPANSMTVRGFSEPGVSEPGVSEPGVSEPGLSMDRVTAMQPAGLSPLNTGLPSRQFGHASAIQPSTKKLMTTDGEIDSLVEKMKQINKDISEFSDDEIRRMIIQGMMTETTSDVSTGFHATKSLDQKMHKHELDQMNIMKPVDRLESAMNLFRNGSISVKAEPFTQLKPAAETGRKPFTSTASMLPQYARPIPMARFTVRPQTASQQRLMARVPQVLRTAVNTFAFSGQRRVPTGWNTPLGMTGMTSMPAAKLTQFGHYGHVPASFLHFDHNSDFVLKPKRAQTSAHRNAHPAYLGNIHQNRVNQESLRNADNLRLQMEKLLSEIERNGLRHRSHPAANAPPTEQSNSSDSRHQSADLADPKSTNSKIEQKSELTASNSTQTHS